MEHFAEEMKSVISSIGRVIEKSSGGYTFREEYVRINGISEYLLHYPADPDAPVIYVMGDRDRTTPYEIAREFFDRMEAPYKEWCFVPDAGHFAMLDNTESWQRILNEAVIKVINSNRTVSGIMKRNPGSL